MTYYTLDNLGKTTETDTYIADGAAVTFGTGSIAGPATGSDMVLTAATSAAYDNRGQLFSSSTISVLSLRGKGTTVELFLHFCSQNDAFVKTTNAPHDVMYFNCEFWPSALACAGSNKATEGAADSCCAASR